MTKKKRREPESNAPQATGSTGREKYIFLALAAAIVVGAVVYTTTRREVTDGGPHGPMATETDPMVAAMIQRFKENPEDIDALKALGNYYYDTGNFPMAEMFYRKVLDIEPDDVDVLVDLGTAYYYSDRAEQAIETYRRALEVEPGHQNALFNLGLVLKATGDREGAVLWWRKFVEMAGDNPHIGPVRDMIAELEAELEEGGGTE